jgi:DNA-binding CsgD family transcriptional regulator
MLRQVADFDYSVMFAYSGDARPIDLFDNFPSSKRRTFVTMYQEGPYLLDPFFLACQKKVPSDLYRLRNLVPDRFYQSEYFRSYYVRTGLSEEIGYFLHLPGGVMVVVSLMRADRSPTFGGREFSALREVHPILVAATTRHWHDLYLQFSPAASPEGQSSTQRNIESAFRNFGRTGLSPREREVVEYVLKGHSSEAIGKVLGIATGTVRIHRKNIYSKLGINSQGELFSQFINALGAGK